MMSSYMWDGSAKQLTKDCPECDYLLRFKFPDEEGYVKVCNWGVAFKVLDTMGNPRACMVIDQPPRNQGRTRKGVREVLLEILFS